MWIHQANAAVRQAIGDHRTLKETGQAHQALGKRRLADAFGEGTQDMAARKEKRYPPRELLSFEMACERFGVLLGRQCRQGQVARARQVAAEIVSRFDL